MKVAKSIRPRAAYLTQLPTLAVETAADGSEQLREAAKRYGIDFRLELKLETQQCKYWLCTRGAEQPGHGPDAWVVGYVTMEAREPNEEGECECWSYGPDSTSWLQAWDYQKALQTELACFSDRQEREPSRERAKQIEATRKELEALLPFLERGP